MREQIINLLTEIKKKKKTGNNIRQCSKGEISRIYTGCFRNLDGNLYRVSHLGYDAHGLVHNHMAHGARPLKVYGALSTLGTEEVVPTWYQGVRYL